MRRRASLIALVLAAALAGCGSTESSSTVPAGALPGPRAVSGPLVVGLAAGAAGWGGNTTKPALRQLISGTSTRWLRDAFQWNMIEPSPGRFSFAYYDHYMLLAAQRGIHIVAQLDGAPSWAAPTPTSLPADPGRYARFVTAVVGRYGPGGSFWRLHPGLASSAVSAYELWNEPYFDNGDGGVYDPGRYARMVKAAGIAGHAVAPSARFLIEAEMQSHLDKVWTWWVDALYRAVPDLNRYFDGVAVHAFGRDIKDLSPIVAGKPYPNFDRVRRIEDLRRQFLAHDAGTKPFWIMETGWATCGRAGCVTPSEQADNLTSLFGYVRGSWRTWVQSVFVYRYQDGADPNTVQGSYGLVRLDGRPKPALRVFRAFAALGPRAASAG